MGQTHVVVSERKKTNFVINANVAVVGKHIRVPKIATVQKVEPNFQLKFGVSLFYLTNIPYLATCCHCSNASVGEPLIGYGSEISEPTRSGKLYL